MEPAIIQLHAILAIQQLQDLLCLQQNPAFVLAKIKCIGQAQQIPVEIVLIIAYHATQAILAHNANLQLINGMLLLSYAKDYAIIYPNIIIHLFQHVLLVLILIALPVML